MSQDYPFPLKVYAYIWCREVMLVQIYIPATWQKDTAYSSRQFHWLKQVRMSYRCYNRYIYRQFNYSVIT